MLNALFMIRVNVVKGTFILNDFKTRRFRQARFGTINNLPSKPDISNIRSELCRNCYQITGTTLKHLIEISITSYLKSVNCFSVMTSWIPVAL